MLGKRHGERISTPLFRIAVTLGILMVSTALAVAPWVGAASGPPEPTRAGQVTSLETNGPSGVPTPDEASDGSVPVCPTHDSTAWHGLYDPDRNCHYTHEHHDNPNAVNDIF